MKQTLCILMVFALLACLAGCGSTDIRRELSETLGVDLTGAAILEENDTHGGFHGDGTTCIALELTAPQKEAVLAAAAMDPHWHDLPLSETAEILLYGAESANGISGPYLHDGSYTPLVPEITGGCWFFLDRHSGASDGVSDENVLQRSSLNFTIALYDADTGILYYLKMDT